MRWAGRHEYDELLRFQEGESALLTALLTALLLRFQEGESAKAVDAAEEEARERKVREPPTPSQHTPRNTPQYPATPHNTH